MNEMISFINDNFKVLMFAVVCLYVFLFIAFKVVEGVRLFKIHKVVEDIYRRTDSIFFKVDSIYYDNCHGVNVADTILDDIIEIYHGVDLIVDNMQKMYHDNKQRVAAENTYYELVEVHNTIKKLNKKPKKKEKKNETN